ncbi:MAG TPA: type VI secretion system-associated FHA domain protein TagH, partial [Burkholderiaceae bacterium]|nr:type VI secretion system-associated FHA domain protein TagH [Burkholderiaceae bacterium]
MNLVLRALSLNDQPLSQAIVGWFDDKGGTIGRSDTNTMTLPDPQRHISRLQAEVIAHDGQFVVRNAAAANAIFVNGRALGPGERSLLASHDELRIGGYVLGVLIEAENEAIRSITQGRAVVDARAVIVSSAVEHRTDPRQMAKGRDAGAAAPLSQPPLPAMPPIDLPLDGPPAPAAPSVDELFAGFGLGSAGAGSADPPAGATPLPAPTSPDIPPTAPAPPPAAPVEPKASPALPVLDHPATMPAVRPLAAPLPVTMTGVPAEAVEGDPLWAAFCDGAGIRADLPQALNADQMRMLGKVLREAVEGTLRLMAVRATAKTELRAAVTTIRARNNNPLKFSPNAQAALEQLVQPPLRGFMAGPLAMQDAMHDLVGHSIGTIAGMRAALAGVLGRFEPGELERKLVGKSVIDSLLPMNRKAKLWDLYLQHFGSISEDARDDFHNLFGAAFVAAYEDQL